MQQVEDTKAVIRVLPIWSTGILPGVIVGQQMFPTLQAKTMQRKVGGREIPAATFGVFSILTLTVWVAVYDRALVRPLSRLTGHARGLSLRQRMGAGLVLFAVAMAVAARRERPPRRRHRRGAHRRRPAHGTPDTHVGHVPGAAALTNGARRGAEPHRADQVLLLRVPQDHVQHRGVAAGARPRLRRRAGSAIVAIIGATTWSGGHDLGVATSASRSPAAAPGSRRTEQMDLHGGVYTSIRKNTRSCTLRVGFWSRKSILMVYLQYDEL